MQFLRSRLVETYVATIFLALMVVSTRAEAPKPADRPMVPLMSLARGMPVPESPEEAARIATTCQLVNAHEGWAKTPLDIAKIKQWFHAANPDFLLSHYRNGSYVAQGMPAEAAEAEKEFPLGIAVWRPDSALAADISADQVTIDVLAPTKRPQQTPAIYPFKPSSTSEEHSRTKYQYVSWLRLDREILRIDRAEADRDRIRLSVQRGVWGSTRSGHGRDADVLVPIYIGSVRQGADVSLGGVPDGKSAMPGLRYALQVQNVTFQRWLGDKCAALFQAGFDVAWLDVTSSSWYNNADAYGNAITPWDIDHHRPLDAAAYLECQQQKLDALFRRFPDRLFFVNNVKPWLYFGPAGERRMLTGETGHHPVSGGSIENYGATYEEAIWRQTVEVTLDFVRSGFAGVAWAKGEGKQDSRRYRLFAYATYLMAWEPGCRMMMGGVGGGVAGKPPEFLYCDLGVPTQRLARIEEAARPDAPGVYQRRFTKGLVLVNPGPKKSGAVRLEEKRFEPESQTRVDQVELDPRSAKLLLAR